MPGLVPGIHVLDPAWQGKPGHDDVALLGRIISFIFSLHPRNKIAFGVS